MSTNNVPSTRLSASRWIAELNANTPPIGFSTSFTLAPTDNGTVFRADSASPTTITVPPNLPEGFNVGIYQRGAGVVTVAAGSGATKVGTGTVTAQNGFVNVYVPYNPTGLAAEFAVLGGA